MICRVLMLLILLVSTQAGKVRAQLLSLAIKSGSGINAVAIDQTNWNTMQNGYNTSSNTIAFSRGALSILGTGVLPKIGLRSSQSSFAYTPASDYPTLTNTVPANVVTAEILTISGSDALTDLLSSILSNSHPVVLKNTEQSMFDGVANVSLKLTLFSSDRPITIKYTISKSGMQQFLKAAGTYTLDLIFNSYNSLNLVNGTVNATLTVTVAPFTVIDNVPDLPRLKFIEAVNYVNGPVSVPEEHVLTLTSTVPYQLKLKSGNRNFKDLDGLTQPNMFTSHLSVKAGTQGSNAINIPSITAADAPLLTAANALQQRESIKYSMDAQYTSAYQKTGTYNSSLIFTLSNNSGTNTIIPKDIYIDVAPISRLSVNGSVNLSYLTADDYRNGVYTDVSDHILLDKNSPYDIYVKANSSFLEGSQANIALSNLLKVELINTGTNMSGNLYPVKLTPNYQPLLAGADAAINKKLSIRYSISAADSKRFLNKPVGTYTTTVTYSFTAQ